MPRRPHPASPIRVRRSRRPRATGRNTLTRPDAAGKTQTLTWTAEGRLASATTPAGTSTYLYDADGNRLLRKDPGRTTLYLGSTELTLNTATNTVTGTRYYSTPGGTTIVRTSDGKLSYVAADHHNTGTTAVDASTLQVQRCATKPFGEDRGAKPTAWPGERGFVGGSQDKSTGLTHLGAREYDPHTGTFLSVDPVLIPDSPGSLNGYGYANNSPVTTSDPTGLCAELDCPTRACATCRNSTPGHAPRPGDEVPGSGSANPNARSGVGANHGSSYSKGSSSPLGRDFNCSLNNCGLTPPGPPVPLPPSRAAAPPPPAPPAPAPPLNCKPDDNRVACMADIRIDDILTDPFHKMNVLNGANVLARDYARKLSDGCAKRAAQYVCFGHSPAGDQMITVGDVHFYPGDKESFSKRLNSEAGKRAYIASQADPATAEKFGPDIERHEAVHSRQWAKYPRAELYAADYAMESTKS
ncbi:RHS repeat-associated core domain-containing protein [Streptomyces sp. NPDC002054]|uniref:RHS repeat domain-containing protein n=1 Tax=Streptomyces sp. NPDC002054 TaxID=3154663 RepID=UPI003332F9CF